MANKEDLAEKLSVLDVSEETASNVLAIVEELSINLEGGKQGELDLVVSSFVSRVVNSEGSTKKINHVVKGLESDAMVLNDVESPVGLEMTDLYFRRYARDDYDSLTAANNGVFTTGKKTVFKVANGEEIRPLAYLRRIKSVYGFPNDSGSLNKWKELAGVEVFKAMDKKYFEDNAADDYEACKKANDGKVTSLTKKPFVAQNGETLTAQSYLSRVEGRFGFKTKVGVIDKWRELAGIQVEKFEVTDVAYFEKHAKSDYEACVKAQGGPVNSLKGEQFTSASGRTLTAGGYLSRMQKAYGYERVAGVLEKWKSLAGFEAGFLFMDADYFKKNAASDYESCSKANGGSVMTISEKPFIAANGESVVAATYIARIQSGFGYESRSGLLDEWKKLASVEVYDKMDKSYFIENAKSDYEACGNANDGFVSTHSQETFVAVSGETMYAQSYIKRMQSAYGLTAIAGVTRLWQELAGYTPEQVAARLEVEELEMLEKLGLEEASRLLADTPARLKLYLQTFHPELANDMLDRLVIRSFKSFSKGGGRGSGDGEDYDEEEDDEKQMSVDEFFELVELIRDMGAEVEEAIKGDRIGFLKECLKLSVLKKFARDFNSGRDYIAKAIADRADEPHVVLLLQEILDEFEAINEMQFPGLNPETRLYFFQKYTVAEIRNRIKEGVPGVIVANEPGLGKTVTALAATADSDTAIISPNAVVTTWGEESAKFLEPDLAPYVLHGTSHAQRKKTLRERKPGRVITNVEFLRNTEDQERFDLLSGNGNRIVIHDEAHGRTNQSSQQSKGAMMLESRFQLLLSASPFKNPKTFRRMMHVLYPDAAEYYSDSAFESAFPPNNPEALKALNGLVKQHTIRFLKDDVLETYDPNQPLEEQTDKLPVRNYISPTESGNFTMSYAQAEAIYEMFMDWQAWTHKYGHYIKDTKANKKDRLKQGDQLSKMHAMRQVCNDPEFVGAEDENEKMATTRATVEQCLAEGRKVLIFCRYNAQASKYAEAFSELNPSLYTGITSDKGFVKEADGKKPQRFKVDASNNYCLDAQGCPIKDPEGEPMTALDYERITFQNDPSRKLVIATYSAGAVGVTFTAAKAVIFDDLPQDYVEEYQAQDRAHRIDNKFRTHHDVKFFRNVSHYPEQFLEDMKQTWVRRVDDKFERVDDPEKAKKGNLKSAYELFFAQGTWDEIQIHNLETQRRMFKLVNDGIVDESYLDEENTAFAA